jgi:menaquinol-cytochrome c reductase iron-sulfur subunit
MENRRSFLGALIALGVSSVGALLSIPLARFSLDPLWRTTPRTGWSTVGAVEQFAAIAAPVKALITVEQRDGWRKIRSTRPVYVVRGADGRLRALSAVCPHLGCTIAWSDERGQFLSPCHNGVFSSDGGRMSGPPPRGMDEFESLVEDGMLKVRYQYFRQLVPTKEVIA